MLFWDYFYHFIHLGIVLINCFGWVFKRTRKIHLLVFGVTNVSWFVIGYFYGIGYCFLTDWHWDVKTKLGETDLPNSYITYMLNNVFGLNVAVKTVNDLILYVYLFILVMTIVLNGRDFYQKRMYAKDN